MQKRKAYFERTDSCVFTQCMTAVGKGLRESWGLYNSNRKAAIANLKRKCENWTNLAESHVKLAWHSRKLRMLTLNLKDLADVVKFELTSYTAKEINWIRKILRCLKKSVETERSTYHRLAINLRKEFPGKIIFLNKS